jgi:Na+-driven multidrug efflux pump
MRWGTLGGVVLMFAALLFGSVLIFQVFDRSSNSASDTIRPFIITMAPVWGVAIAASAVLLRKPRG